MFSMYVNFPGLPTLFSPYRRPHEADLANDMGFITTLLHTGICLIILLTSGLGCADFEIVSQIASPLPGQTGDFEANTIQPAIHGTTSILASALKVPTVRRIVITSSTGAITGESETEVYNGKDAFAPWVLIGVRDISSSFNLCLLST